MRASRAAIASASASPYIGVLSAPPAADAGPKFRKGTTRMVFSRGALSSDSRKRSASMDRMPVERRSCSACGRLTERSKGRLAVSNWRVRMMVFSASRTSAADA